MLFNLDYGVFLPRNSWYTQYSTVVAPCTIEPLMYRIIMSDYIYFTSHVKQTSTVFICASRKVYSAATTARNKSAHIGRSSLKRFLC